jgi:hypothetical protein
MGEIAYQMVYQGFNASLLKEVKKKNFIPYGFRLGHYFIKDPKHARKEATSHLEYWFSLGQFRRHDPKGLVAKHCDLVSTTVLIVMRSGNMSYSSKMLMIGMKYWKERRILI